MPFYDDVLEKPYYWDDDQDTRIKVADKVEGHKIEYKRKPVPWEKKLPSLKEYKPRKPVVYKTPWTNMEDYAKQCKRSEEK